MADLDDFFAKKDRKKSKGKKFATADEIAKKLEETGKRTEKLKKEKLQTSQIGSQELDEQGNTVQVQDEDEWREFEEEKKDYSGLKIQNLTVDDDYLDDVGSGGEGEDEGGMEENEAGELVPKRRNGPWRVVSNPAGGGGDEVAAQEEAPPTQPAPAPSTGAYVPPSLRNKSASAQSQTQTPFNARLRRKAAPDVKNEELFPTLSAANTQESAVASSWGKKKGKDDYSGTGGFEEVKNSRSHTAKYEPPHVVASRASLSLGNKYGALDNEQS